MQIASSKRVSAQNRIADLAHTLLVFGNASGHSALSWKPHKQEMPNSMNLHSEATPADVAAQIMPTIDREMSVLQASKLMRESGTNELLVTSDATGMTLPLGIVTATDIVTRVIAAELDPAVLTMGDIAWGGLTLEAGNVAVSGSPFTSQQYLGGVSVTAAMAPNGKPSSHR
jgi:hypothetical protein